MVKRLLLCLFILLQGICFAYDKQNDEYSCGVVSVYNLINDKCPDCKNNEIPELSKLLKTDENGTTTFNLCNGLEKYFAKQKISADIKYYGIKKIRKFKENQNIDFKTVEQYFANGYSAIINIGIYKKLNNTYIRQYGHYVNLISINDNELKIFDPYDKENEFSYWQMKQENINLQNINDNEKYEKSENNLYIVLSPINYLEQDEYAIINGIILVKILDK